MTTPKSPNSSDDIRQSIAALRSVLMLDTPARNILGRRLPSPQQSPATHQQQQNEASSPLVDGNGGGTVPEDRLKDEIQRRQKLEASYESLLKLQKQKTAQMETVVKSRRTLEEQVAKLEKEIGIQSENHVQERFQWQHRLRAVQQEKEVEKEQQHALQLQSEQSKADKLARELQSVRSELESKTAELERQSKEWKGQVDDLQTQLADARAMAEAAKNAQESYQQEVASTRKELAESKQEFLSWKDQSLEKQHMLEKKIKEYFDLNAELTQNLQQKSTQLEASNQKLNVSENALSVSELQVLELNEELSAIKSRLKDHQDSSALLEQAESIDHVKAENETLKQQLQEALARVTEMDNVKKQIDANQGIVVTNDEMLRKLELELEDARAKISQGATREGDHVKRLKDAKTAYEKLRSDYEELDYDLQVKKEAIAEKDRMLEDANSRMDKLKQSVASPETSDDTVRKLQSELKKLQRENASLTNQLQTVKATHENHLVEVATNRERIREVEGLLEDSRNRVAELQSIADQDLLPGTGVSPGSLRKRSRK